MSNLTATVKVLQRGAPHADAVQVLCPYHAESQGTIDVADTTVAGDFTVPFGAIGVEATYALIKNTLNQDIKVKINSASTTFRMAPGSILLIALAAASGGATKLTAITCTTTATQSGDGVITYQLLGDPT